MKYGKPRTHKYSQGDVVVVNLAGNGLNPIADILQDDMGLVRLGEKFTGTNMWIRLGECGWQRCPSPDGKRKWHNLDSAFYFVNEDWIDDFMTAVYHSKGEIK